MLKQMSFEQEFTNSYNKDEYSRVTTSRSLNSYNVINDFIYEIIYYQKDIDMAISSKSVMMLQTLDNFYFKYLNWKNTDMIDDIHNKKTPFWRPFENVVYPDGTIANMLTYVYPLSISSTYSLNSMVIQIDRPSFVKALNIPTSNKNIVIIRDNNDNILFSTVSDTEKYITAINSLNLSSSSEIAGKEYEDMYISFRKSGQNNWSYYNILPLEQVLSKAENLQKTYITLTILMLLLGSILIYIITYISYNPIKGLLQTIENTLKITNKSKSEFETAKMAISYLSESSQALEEKIRNSSKHVKSSILLNLLHGNYQCVDDLNNQGTDYGIHYEKKNFFCIVITYKHISADKKSSSCQYLIESIESLICLNYEGYGLENLDRNCLIFLCSTDDMDENAIKKFLKSISANICERYNIQLKIGVSTTTNNVTLLYRKYIEALNAIEYAPSSSDTDIVFYGSVKFTLSMNYPEKEIESLKNALLEYDVDQFTSVFMFLLNYVNGSKLSLFVKICVLYDIYNTVIKTMRSLDSDALPELQKYNIALADKNNILENMSDMLDNLLKDVSAYLIKHSECINKTLSHQIKAYVGAHLFDYDFSIQTIADHFDMSLSNISRHFKNETGLLLSDYISEIKINYAKEALRNTDMSLQEIMYKIGYTSMSSFIRKFKSDTGTTPGEYKSIHGKKR